MGQAQQNGNIDFELSFYEAIVKERPHFEEALIALGDLYTKKGCFKEGLEVDLKLSNLRPEDPVVFYNLACSYSLLKNIDQSYTALRKAIECGYDDFKHMLQDQDLNNLKHHAGFKEFLDTIKEEKARES